jgi:hypothetical protein
MYDRAPRNLSEPFGSTLESVGPGTYENEVPSKAKQRSGENAGDLFSVEGPIYGAEGRAVRDECTHWRGRRKQL